MSANCVIHSTPRPYGVRYGIYYPSARTCFLHRYGGEDFGSVENSTPNLGSGLGPWLRVLSPGLQDDLHTWDYHPVVCVGGCVSGGLMSPVRGG